MVWGLGCVAVKYRVEKMPQIESPASILDHSVADWHKKHSSKKHTVVVACKTLRFVMRYLRPNSNVQKMFQNQWRPGLDFTLHLNKKITLFCSTRCKATPTYLCVVYHVVVLF